MERPGWALMPWLGPAVWALMIGWTIVVIVAVVVLARRRKARAGLIAARR